MEETVEESEEAFDPLRDGPLRYLGYANELGEAFAAFLPPGGVPLSYAVAIGYVLVDTADKGMKAKAESMVQLDKKKAMLPEDIDPECLPLNSLHSENILRTEEFVIGCQRKLYKVNSISSICLEPPSSIRQLSSLLAGERALDTVIWQLLASVAIPGETDLPRHKSFRASRQAP
eukprot:scaffold62339_cov27-Prasinocladus_malaysianus.AAC.3